VRHEDLSPDSLALTERYLLPECFELARRVTAVSGSTNVQGLVVSNAFSTEPALEDRQERLTSCIHSPSCLIRLALAGWVDMKSAPASPFIPPDSDSDMRSHILVDSRGS